MPYDVGYARRRFPQYAAAIDELADQSESFRELCLDFETADITKLKWQAADTPEAKERYAELHTLSGYLAVEIEQLIQARR